MLLGPGAVREDSAEKAMFMDFVTNVSYRAQPSRLGCTRRFCNGKDLRVAGER